MRTLVESKKGDYYKPVRDGNAFSNNYNQYRSKGDKKDNIDVMIGHTYEIITELFK